MNFCCHCGAPVQVAVPPGDNLPRHICSACGSIHYQNPKLVVGSIPEWEDRILLCRRAIEPRLGRWTLPAGFMENGETLQQGAARETLEEAQARIVVGDLYSLFNLPHISQVYVLFRSRLLDLDFGPGAESLEVRLLREEEIPWDELAFAVIRESLHLYFRDRAAGRFRLHCGDIIRSQNPHKPYRLRLHNEDRGDD
ncbi:MAG: NUDIX domain-containing protein [Chromatiaceae bacterium]|nr:MAG: NUDIX domain-containing protein [Chromatiaceae bacterium]